MTCCNTKQGLALNQSQGEIRMAGLYRSYLANDKNLVSEI
jgi:hypothetical protein